MTEAQKYGGVLHKEKSKRKSVTISEPPQVLRQPYVEDVPEMGDGVLAVVAVPPQAPSPPPSAPPLQASQPVNVFDFLVNETPNASRVSLPCSREQMQMVAHAPPLFKSATPSPQEEESEHFEKRGYGYGEDPVEAKATRSYQTPAPKTLTYQAPQDTKSTDKKRKRQVEGLDLTQARRPSQELDEEMDIDDGDSSAPPVLHSGLTGGLNKLLSSSKFPPSPDDSGSSEAHIITVSPIKRPKVAAGTAGSVKVEKTRGRNANRGQLVRVRKVRRTSDESRPRKHHRPHRSSREQDEPPERAHRAVKALEYHRSASPDGSAGAALAQTQAQQLVVYRSRAAMFLSFVTKGPESESGCSIKKALKRYHRERGEHGADKADEEKELWKSLRLKRNERGEVVLLLGDRTS